MSNQSTLRDSVITIAGIIIILFAARIAQSLVIPFLLSIFITIIILVPFRWLKQHGVSNTFAVGISILIALGLELFLTLLLGKSIAQFSRAVPRYQEQLASIMRSINEWMAAHHIEFSDSGISDILNPNVVLSFANNFLAGFGSVLSNVLLIMLTVLFMLLEANKLPAKISSIDNSKQGTLLKNCSYILESTKQYIFLKALTSLLTGILVTVGLTIIGLDFASLWGFLAFLLNFIPNIGSVIAAAPAVLLACLQLSSIEILTVIALYLAVNIVIGNFLEPAIMGQKVGLSTLSVFLSLLFWGWLLGPAGMLLSVPLTMVIKYGAETNEKTRWLAVLLSSAPATTESSEE
ncbi:AI-2E family transporter [Halodesulfovibrio spirochaetisodalis]|uniref:AI-2E family transporter n=1 Tax=Halodesulfovibrio spirochaetisodalis TaxID=1560234 RepID=UPI00082FEB61|nr:AI-2E family transporter [Halodesulfovibrio spirochaetisodalis]